MQYIPFHKPCVFLKCLLLSEYDIDIYIINDNVVNEAKDCTAPVGF